MPMRDHDLKHQTYRGREAQASYHTPAGIEHRYKSAETAHHRGGRASALTVRYALTPPDRPLRLETPPDRPLLTPPDRPLRLDTTGPSALP
jgi:hypothetical protein